MRLKVQQESALTCSAGIGPNRLIAKICSDFNKPNGQYRISNSTEEVEKFVQALPTRKMFGIGKVAAFMLKETFGIETIQDLYEKRALLMFLHQRDAIFQQIESGKLSYVRSEGQRYVRNNIIDILSGREIPKRSESEEKAKAKKTKARKREAEENKIIKSMTKRDLTPSQRKDIKAIETLAAKIEMEAEKGQKVPHLVKNWWKQADLDKFLKRKKNELKEMETQNENSENSGEGGYCTLM